MGEAPSAARRQLWVQLSELFLDTEPTEATRTEVLRALTAAPFDAEELDRIWYGELQPTLRANLRSVAGEWAGFDPDWLVAAVSERAVRPAGRRGRSAVDGLWEELKRTALARR